MNPHPRLLITSGEPAGIGPDIVLQALQKAYAAQIIVLADPALLFSRAKSLGVSIQLEEVDSITTTDLEPHDGKKIRVYPIALAGSVIAGKVDVNNANYVIDILNVAGGACLSGQCDAIVTAPVHKAVINEAGIQFTGHTEFLANLANVEQVVMMLASKKMRVVLVTTHVPLRQVADLITKERLHFVIETTIESLKNEFSIKNPKIMVAGLNPHAGEGGYLGQEEQTIISPVIQALQQKHIDIQGPFSADTLFVQHQDQVDAFVAMYHDQGLPVLKYSSFGEAVNVTLGLPFIRTSVDHGTALELAGTGKANAGSLRWAIDYAIQMAQSKQRLKSSFS